MTRPWMRSRLESRSAWISAFDRCGNRVSDAAPRWRGQLGRGCPRSRNYSPVTFPVWCSPPPTQHAYDSGVSMTDQDSTSRPFPSTPVIGQTALARLSLVCLNGAGGSLPWCGGMHCELDRKLSELHNAVSCGKHLENILEVLCLTAATFDFISIRNL